MQSGVKTLSAGGGASLCCLLLLWLIYSHLLREGQLAVGTCEIVMLNRDSSVPRRTIARQTARCACRRGQIAGTTRARPACVDARIVRSRQWCEMAPCLEGEVCSLLFNRSGWTCTRGSGRIKTVTCESTCMNGAKTDCNNISSASLCPRSHRRMQRKQQVHRHPHYKRN